MVRTRIAPSPTGYPHIGTIYQALFNYAYAKKNNGKFLVRIEDTDRNRFVEGAEDVIFKALDWFGLQEDESPRKNGEYGPYRQSERLERYHKYAQELIEKKLAYFAYYAKADAGQKKDYTPLRQSFVEQAQTTSDAPPQSINEMIERGDWIVRMKVDKTKPVTFKDEIRGEITFEGDQVTEQVLIKSDGFPTYHLAAVVDDHEMGITHVVRGEEWISSTPKHILLYRYFGWGIPKFYHTPTLRNPDKSKLSKRHGHTNVTWFQEEGYLPEAILNFLGLMGWSHPEEKEHFSLEDFINVFDLKDIRQVGPIFDLTKLTWMNQQYIQLKSDEELKQLLINFYPDAKKLSQETFNKLLPLLKTRMKTLKEFAELTVVFFEAPMFPKLEEKELDAANELNEELSKQTEWDGNSIFQTMKAVMINHSVKMPLFYKLFTGKERGLPLPQILEILGKDSSLALLERARTI
jgi:glutamyl-tRNA synthetase